MKQQPESPEGLPRKIENGNKQRLARVFPSGCGICIGVLSGGDLWQNSVCKGKFAFIEVSCRRNTSGGDAPNKIGLNKMSLGGFLLEFRKFDKTRNKSLSFTSLVRGF